MVFVLTGPCHVNFLLGPSVTMGGAMLRMYRQYITIHTFGVQQ